jgi:hypothetical protein
LRARANGSGPSTMVVVEAVGWAEATVVLGAVGAARAVMLHGTSAASSMLMAGGMAWAAAGSGMRVGMG